MIRIVSKPARRARLIFESAPIAPPSLAASSAAPTISIFGFVGAVGAAAAPVAATSTAMEIRGIDARIGLSGPSRWPPP